MTCNVCGQDPCICQSSETEPEAPPRDLVMESFQNRSDRPGAETIERWKVEHGEVYVFAFDETEMYIWRPLKRLEYKHLKAQIKNDNDIFMEAVVQKCVLWPHLPPEFSAICKAGTINTLYEVIMQGSNFIDPQLAANLLVRKL